MINIPRLDGWGNSNSIAFSKEDSDLKSLEDFATSLHNGVECANKQLKESSYVIHTIIKGEENNYLMLVKIKYYESKNEHKKNTHRQEINL